MRSVLVSIMAFISVSRAIAQDSVPPPPTRADTLRGSITAARAWWDVAMYQLDVTVRPADSSLVGVNHITYRVLESASEMQIDLQRSMAIDSVVHDGNKEKFRRDGNAYFVSLSTRQQRGSIGKVSVYYSGKPTVAKNAPWDGGVVWTTDSLGQPWVATACQIIGASTWWPTKDTQADEPDSMHIAVTVPDPLKNVSNGRLREVIDNGDGTSTYKWAVRHPINTYGVTMNVGDYAQYTDTYDGERGRLTLGYWPLPYHLENAKRQFEQVKPTLACFEHWFGPYPWYGDGFQLIETPHLGMEHQSAIAYGNQYQNGYLGRDLSQTGIGLTWDFIIVHETAHEWWGNSITTADVADMWVHESFANYAEGLFVECQSGKAAGAAYIRGNRNWIKNDKPIVGEYGINREGSGDMYPKGGNMLHLIRQVIGNDAKWRLMLRGINQAFRHKIVTGKDVRDYFIRESRIDLGPIFDQYLTTNKVPVLEYRLEGSTLEYRWADVVPRFAIPIRVRLGDSGYRVIRPTTKWQRTTHRLGKREFAVDPDYYVVAKRVDR